MLCTCPGWEVLSCNKKVAVLPPENHRSGIQLERQRQRTLPKATSLGVTQLSQEPLCRTASPLAPAQYHHGTVCQNPHLSPLTTRPARKRRTNSSLPPSAFVTLTTLGQTLLQKLSVIRIYQRGGAGVSEAVVMFVQIAAHITSFLFLLLRKGSPTPVTPDPAVSWGVKCHSDWTEGQRDLCLAPGSPTS